MRHHASWIIWIAIAAALILVLLPLKAHGQPVILSVETQRGNDTLYVGEQAFISFDVDGQGAQISGCAFPLKFTFESQGLIGSMPNDAWMEFKLPITEMTGWRGVSAPLGGSDQDSLKLGMILFGESWITTGSEWLARIHFQPRDTGRIRIDSIWYFAPPPKSYLSIHDPTGSDFPIEWQAVEIAVLPCPNVLGDVNQNRQVTSSDIIQLVNCVFLCGSGPFDILVLGDVNCDGVATVSDVILLVNYAFKGVPLPFCCKVLN